MPRALNVLVALAAAGAALVIASSGALAAAGRVSPQYQGYSAPGGEDPYASDNPKDIHVTGYGGQPGVNGFLKLNLDSIPTGSTIDGLQLKLVPNSSQTDNVNSGAAAIQACLLTQPLNGDGYQANPPSYDCADHATGEPQADGSWQFELAPIASHWATSNTGVAFLSYGTNGTPAGNVAPSAWSVAFDHTKTAAVIDYVPGQATSQSFFTGPATVTSGGGSLQPLPAPAPAPAPAPQLQPPASSTGTAPGQAAAPTIVMQPRAQKQWLWLTGALVAAAILMVLVGAAQQAMRGGRLQIGTALAASRSQLATPVAVLALAAVFALGSTSQLIPVVVTGRGGAAGGASGSANGSVTGVPGSGGTVGSSGAAGSGAGSTASGSSASTTNGGQDGPGVTSTTVRVGFSYVTDTQSANNAFGVHVPNPGNEQAEEQAMVDYVNKHGGIAGRQIQPVYVGVDNAKAETDPTIGEETCTTFTEDYHVFAVVAGGGAPDGAASNACYVQHGTINFDASVSGALDQAFMKAASPYIWLNEDATLDRVMRWEISGLQSRGFFSGGTATAPYKLGVVIADDSTNRRAYTQETLPMLQSAGVQNPDTFYVPHDTLSDIANTMKQAVIHFQADGVTNVIFQGGGNYGTGSYALLFMLDSESQHYTPRYGLSSEDGPVALAGNVPQDQLNGALSVGWFPGADTDDAHIGPFPSTPGERKCEGIMTASGNGDNTRESNAGLLFCDVVLQFQQAAAGLTGQPLNAQLLGDQLMRLGPSTFTADLTRADFGPGHWDAPGGYRLLHAVQNCEGSNACFEYDNASVYS